MRNSAAVTFWAVALTLVALFWVASAFHESRRTVLNALSFVELPVVNCAAFALIQTSSTMKLWIQ